MPGPRAARALVLVFQICLGLFSALSPLAAGEAVAASGTAGQVEIDVQPSGCDDPSSEAADLEADGSVNAGVVVTRVRSTRAIRVLPAPTRSVLSSTRAGPGR